jgi:uncharacterized membrane protein
MANQHTSLNLDELSLRNIETISRIEQAANNKRTRSDVVADSIAGFCGSTVFVYVHCLWFGVWLLWNSVGWVAKQYRWDPPPFNMLTLVVSLEAIFLSTFILISQNRQQKVADQRNHLDLQINMLAEQESSQMLLMMKALMEHLDVPIVGELHEALIQETNAEQLAEHIENVIGSTDISSDLGDAG